MTIPSIFCMKILKRDIDLPFKYLFQKFLSKYKQVLTHDKNAFRFDVYIDISQVSIHGVTGPGYKQAM